MSVISGIGGVVNGRTTIRAWSVDHSAEEVAAYTSNSKGGPVQISSITDWSGQFTGYGTIPPIKPGDTFTFTGIMSNSKGVQGTAMCDEVELAWDIEGGQPLGYTVNFSGNSLLTKGTFSASDTSIPAPPTSLGTKIEIGTMDATPTWDSAFDVRTITLTISRENPDYASSQTYDAVSGLAYRKRVKGNFSAQVAISLYTDDFDALPDPNFLNRLRLYVDASTYWLLEFIKWTEVSGMEVDIEGAGLVAATLTGKFSGYGLLTNSTVVEGKLVDPSNVQWWP